MAIAIVSSGIGKTGGRVAELALAQKDLKVVSGVCSDCAKHAGSRFPLFPEGKIAEAMAGGEVFVDFSNVDAAMRNLPKAAKAGLNLVVGTTGFSDEQLAKISQVVEENKVSAVIAPNFSVGVNLFFKFAHDMAKALSEYDVEIIECHHNKKKDSPSGTAMKAAKVVAQALGIPESAYKFGRNGIVGPRGREIGIHAIRAGDIVGEHTVLFAGNCEQIKLSHAAQSRDCFASGALKAIRWVAGRRDGKVHSMNDVLGI
ncbi:MAG: 4-hydroxy-tetrahydrodipicolinate reductase [Candidatus Micrarchaeia archaeon]|jgi:4-hydroxy-tetrahydrodipicolinate reductase